MQEENNSTLYLRRQNGWSKHSIYTLNLLPKDTKQVTKCHAFQVCVAFENVEPLDVCVCVCGVCVCVRVSVLCVLCVCVWFFCVFFGGFACLFISVGGGVFGRVCIRYTWCQNLLTELIYDFLTAGRNSYVPDQAADLISHRHCLFFLWPRCIKEVGLAVPQGQVYVKLNGV